MLVECKHQHAPIKREVIQILRDRLQSVGASKGILVSTSGFQSGAVKYADTHGIALIQLIEGKSTYFTKSMGSSPEPPPWANIPPYAGWLVSVSDTGGERYSLIEVERTESIRQFLRSDG